MIYTDFQDKKLSMLGFGTMRLPMLADGSIDQAQVEAMTECAMEQGVNYFDTAWPYHNGLSEVAIGKALSAYPRESWYLADKFPGHQVSKHYDPAAVFEEQLKKCGVEYFDFYLLHNVYENSIQVYLDERWGILEYFREQKRLGRIRHLGFSTHGRIDLMERFLEIAGADMEFCQIQVNWLDWTLQDAQSKVALLNRYHIPIWVMEPVRGGKLCTLMPEEEAKLRALRPEESIPGWGFRFLQGIPGVTMVLSGMSNMTQMQENIQTFSASSPLNEVENGTLLGIAEGLKKSVPCTACRYCVDQCPMGLAIPQLIATYNDISVEVKLNSVMWLEGLPADKQPAACLKCGKCAKMCPQGIDIPGVMEQMAAKLETVPKWSDICRQREEDAKKLRKQ